MFSEFSLQKTQVPSALQYSWASFC